MKSLAWLLTVACASGASEADQPVTLHGSVQKGPFVIGSSVSVSLLDSRLAPTGQVFNTQTTNDRGEFDIEFPASGPVALEGEGFYFNEVTGQLSQAALTLRAFYSPDGSGEQRVFVNMITHLTAERIKALVAQGTAFAIAVTQAEDELREQLHITGDDYRPSIAGAAMDITGGDTRDNAYLLGVSSVLIQVALAGGGSLDAELQELLNGYSLDLANDGGLVQNRRNDVAAALASLQVDSIRENLATRLQELGSDDAIPQMRNVLDQAQCCQQGSAFAGCRVSATLPVCDSGLACAPGDGCPGTEACCLPAGDLGQPCAQPLASDCPDPNFCPVANVCNAGLACQFRDAGPPTFGASVCLPGGALDQPCIEGACDSGLICTRSRGPLGSCGQRDCCEPPTVCSQPQDCGIGLTCGGSPAFCAGQERCCVSPQQIGVGQPCGADAPCPDGLLCQMLMPGYDDSTQCDVDRRGTLDQACRADGSCGEGLSCTDQGARGYVCQPHTGALGEPCTGDSAIVTPTCEAGLACTYGGSCAELASMSCCLPPGEAGDPCSDDSCGSGLACVRTGCPSNQNACCAPAGGEGEPCLPDRTCDEGLDCELAPLGASRCSAPRCQPDCLMGSVCDLQANQCVPVGCSGPADCSGAAVCDMESGTCVPMPCTGPIDCPEGLVCDTATEECVEP